MGRIVMESRQFSYGSFIWRRFLRIYPAFLASLFAATWLAVGLGYKFDFIVFLENLVFLNAVKELNVPPYNHVTWSLGYQFAFYLVLPLILWLSRAIGNLPADLALFIAAALVLPGEYLPFFAVFAGTAVSALP